MFIETNSESTTKNEKTKDYCGMEHLKPNIIWEVM